MLLVLDLFRVLDLEFFFSLTLIQENPNFCMNKNKLTCHDLHLPDINTMHFGLDPICRVLERMGRVHEQLPVIHIAGTNGKGSTACFIKNILCASDYTVGLYTSPHLSDITERIAINNTHITLKTLQAYLSRVQNVAARCNVTLTYFELLTLVAIQYFIDEKVDVAIMEAGLGGRLDATNVFPHPLVTIITSIGLEHTRYLGNTLTKILTEKMGITRQRVPIISGVQQKKLWHMLRHTAKKFHAPLYIINKDFCMHEEKKRVETKNFQPLQNVYFQECTTQGALLKNLCIASRGTHQIHNASLAVRTALVLRSLGFTIHDDHIRQGLLQPLLPGRFECVPASQNKIKTNLVFDVAHNVDGIKTFLKTFEHYCPRPDDRRKGDSNYTKRYLIFGVLKDKRYSTMAQLLAPHFDEIYLIKPSSSRALDPSTLYKKFRRHILHKKNILIFYDFNALVAHITHHCTPSDIVAVTGSFYCVGDMRRLLWLHLHPNRTTHHV